MSRPLILSLALLASSALCPSYAATQSAPSYHKGATVTGKFKHAHMIMEASPSMDMMDVGNPNSMAYAGRITVTLKDGTEIEAECPLATLRTLRGYSEVRSYDRKQAGMTVNVALQAEEQKSNPQHLVLIYDGPKKWRVKGIVK